MKQSIVHVALVIKEYEEAIDFYTETSFHPAGRHPPVPAGQTLGGGPIGVRGATLLLAKASKPDQEPFVGNQTGGRVLLFLNTDDLYRDYHEMVSKGIQFVRAPKEEVYGLVAVLRICMAIYGICYGYLPITQSLYGQRIFAITKIIKKGLG